MSLLRQKMQTLRARIAVPDMLLRLQRVVSQAQVVSRISAGCGNHSTLETAVPRSVQPFVDWRCW